jgi:transposase
VVVDERHNEEEPSAMQITTIGLDLAKQWFQVHGVDAAGNVVIKRRLRRTEVIAFFQGLEPCLVGMEACASAHHWARELIALGHDVKLMPPIYVKAYVKRNKNDAADAEAICEAVTRPSMRFVPIKTIDQQAVLLLHRARSLLVRQRTMLVNALRAHLAEFGIIAPQGLRYVERLILTIDDDKIALPELAREILRLIAAQLNDTTAKVRQIETRLAQWHRSNPVSKLLATVPGVGIMGASAIAATVGDPNLFRSGREFAAWLGMTPRQNSSGGKERLGRTSKRGDKYIRCLLIAGAVAILRHARTRTTKDAEWVRTLLARKPAKVVAVALANKTARIVWAVMKRGAAYQPKEIVGQMA